MTQTLPYTREALDALPYQIDYGHWGITAWAKRRPFSNDPYVKLGEVSFPVSSRGPFDPPEVRNRLFAELDAQARSALT